MGRPGRIRRFWRFWVDLFSRREDGAGLAWFRIAIGLVLTYSLLSIGLHGLVGFFWVDLEHGGYIALGSNTWLMELLGGPSGTVTHGVYYGTLLGVALMTLGVGGPLLGRLIIFATLQGYLGLVTLNPDAGGGYDIMLTNALWLLTLSDATATHSLSCRMRTGAWSRAIEVMAWPRYLLAFQLLTVYTATGLQKLSPGWTPAGGFSALFTIFQDPTWRRFDMDWTASVYPATQVATAVTWFFEILAPVMLLVFYFRYTRDKPGRVRRAFNRWDLRIPFTVTGLMLHAGILITLNVGPFSWVSMAYYICIWQPDEVSAAVSRFFGLLRSAAERLSRRSKPAPTEP